MTTNITVVGTIATDPKFITLSNGVAICSFRIASDERRYNREKQDWVDGPTNWFGVSCFRTIAKHARDSFRKGERIIVQGRIRMRDWENDNGKTGTSIEIEAESIGHDIRWGVSRFERRQQLQQSDPQHATAQPGPNEPAQSQPAPLEQAGTPSREPEVVELRTSAGEPSQDGFIPDTMAA